MNSNSSVTRDSTMHALDDAKGLAALSELALDMRSTWNHVTDEIWRRIDLQLWSLTQNPWLLLQTVSRATLQRCLKDQEFSHLVSRSLQSRRDTAQANAWFQTSYSASPLTTVAYFSMEFMLSEALPIYSGGLGNVAGDQLKAASDLAVPMVGVGLLYAQGYFRQAIDAAGAQQALYPYNDPGQLPVKPLLDEEGDALRLEVPLRGYSIWLRTWQVQVGRVKLYLLDSNDAANYPTHRGITSELYGGSPEVRLQQELILGIGGWRLLRALGIQPEICHLNEGHAAFAILERAHDLMQAMSLPFEAAFAISRAGNLFTTHTAVAAGFDRFSPDLIERHLGDYAETKLQISIEDLLQLGRVNATDAAEPFNMAYFAIRGSGAVNGVSTLHGKVSRALFAPLFPGWPLAEVPVGAVTNGIHTPTWDSAAADSLWTEACGKDRWTGSSASLEQGLSKVSDTRLWAFRNEARSGLVDFARKRASTELATSGASAQSIEAATHFLDVNTLTLGFARRFASYKRPNLLLHDPERLVRLLNDSKRPVQLILAGKAHPADHGGQALIQEWTAFCKRPEVNARVIFLSDYDMRLTQELVQGVDVWINTPRRPWEACGTSGMKVLVNGGINLSELDGWWAEAYRENLGWALGDGSTHGSESERDAGEAIALYELLEQKVVPEFYARNELNVPPAWTARMRQSMEQLTPQFSAARAVQEYTQRYYVPGAEAYRTRVDDKGKVGIQITEWQRRVAQHWPQLRFGAVRVTSDGRQHQVEADLLSKGFESKTLVVEWYANGDGNNSDERYEMTPDIGVQGDLVTYRALITTTRAMSDFTVRVHLRHEAVSVPLESNQILWQR